MVSRARHPRDGRLPHGARPGDLAAESLEPAACVSECFRHRRCVHDLHRQPVALAVVYGADRARGGSCGRRAREAEPVSDPEFRTGASVPMTRRDALKAATALMGALTVSGLLEGCAPDGRDATPASRASAQDDQALLEDIADTLLPDTKASPGAKAAGVGATMALLLADCKTLEVQQRVAAGLRAFRATCRASGGPFESLP